MKQNELRVGNYVSHPRKKIDTIKGVNSNDHGYYATFDNTHEGYYFENEGFEQVSGIPITKEWLLKFGFKFEAPFYRNDTFQAKKDKDSFLVYQFSDFLRRVYYVHQFQNLYFALTGQELEAVEPTE
ncbi:hypothetical protein [Bizionia sp. M204]|uniref:hypothetical protein n=1 Tax=Bizionia sp. M204 TaxID=2675331 RepID=UPI00206C83C8|nr:hypothetical protein [Bizionia sp. M204]UPS92069.1 hypothetical protein GMA17_10200 [Bizionia sp. M204]